MKVKIYSVADILERNIKYFELRKVESNKDYRLEWLEKSLNNDIKENLDFWKDNGCKYLAVFLHTNYWQKPKENYMFTEEAYFLKYYCEHSSTVMFYPADMIYSRGSEWVVESPEYFKIEKDETETAFLIDLTK